MKRRYPDGPIVAVGGIVVKDGGVLLIRRGKEPSYGLWSVPGGAVELGEGLRAATQREVREECGIEIGVTDVIEVLERVVRDADDRIQYHYVLVDYLAYWISGDLTPSDELLDARWIAEADLPNFAFPEFTLGMLRQAFALIR